MAEKSICTVSDCDKPAKNRGLCVMHYSRLMRHGRLDKETREDRFWKRVAIRSVDECWDWTGAKDKDGYGNVTYNGRSMRASRVSWQLTNGEIPEGMFVCHSCDNPPCVNPGHLFVGTPAQNSADRDGKGRANVAKGSGQGTSILTEDIVIRIRDLLSEGRLTQREIGQIYGVSQTAVCNISTGRRWGWMDPARH